MPSVGAIVSTPEGNGVVQSVTLVSGNVKVKLDSEAETQIKEFSAKDIKIIKNASKNQNDADVDMKELKKLEDN